MCSAARSVQRLGAGFGAGPENDDDAKEFTTPVKVENFGDTRRFGLRLRLPWVVLLLSIVAVVGGRVVFVAYSLESKQCGRRCDERSKPIEFFCGCCFQKISFPLFVNCNTTIRPRRDSTCGKRTYDVGGTGCICSDHQSKKMSSRTHN
jgi:hypothetical protein